MATGDILAQVADQRTVEEIKNSIGETDDTGGSTVAGTAMAKMNKAIEDTGLINESILFRLLLAVYLKKMFPEHTRLNFRL